MLGHNGRWFIKGGLQLWTMIAGGALAIPFLFSKSTADPFLPPRFLVTAALTLSIFVVYLIHSNFHRRVTPCGSSADGALVWLLVNLLISAVSLSGALNFGAGIYAWLNLFLFYAFCIGARLTLGNDFRRTQSLIKAIVLSAIPFAMIGWPALLVPDLSAGSIFGSVSGTMGNRNLYASAMFLFLPFVLFAVLCYRGWWFKMGFLGLILLFSGIWVTGARSAWVAILFSGGVVIFSTRIGRSGLVRRRFPSTALEKHLHTGSRPMLRSIFPFRSAMISIGVVMSIGIAILAPGQPDGKTSIPGLLSADSLNQRILLWTATIRMVGHSPLMGVGPGQWKLQFPNYGPMNPVLQEDGIQYEIVFQRPHNDYLLVLAEHGILGLVCMILFYGLLIRQCYRVIKNGRDLSEQKLGACMLFGLIGYMVIACFSFPGERIFHNVFLGFITATILSSHDRLETGHDRQQAVSELWVTRWHYLSLIGLLTVCVWVGWSRCASDVHTSSALQAMSAGDDANAIAHLRLAETWLYTLDPTSTPLAFYRALAHHRLGQEDQARRQFVRACNDHPNHLHALVNAARYQLMGGNRFAAEVYSMRARRLSSSSR